MPLWNKWRRKPPQGTPIDRTHPLVQGMQGFYALNEAGARIVNDSIGSLPLLANGYATLQIPWASGTSPAIITLGSGTGFVGNPIPITKLTYPATMACGMKFAAAPTGGPRLVGITGNVNTSADYFTFTVNTTFSIFAANGAGRITLVNIGPLPTVGVDTVISATLTPSAYAYYKSGTLAASGATTLAPPTYVSVTNYGPGFNMMNYGASGGSSNELVYWFAWWNRALSPAEHALIGSSVDSIWQIMQPPPENWLIHAPTFSPSWAPPSPVIGSGVY